MKQAWGARDADFARERIRLVSIVVRRQRLQRRAGLHFHLSEKSKSDQSYGAHFPIAVALADSN
jgi:hypothetical protein